MRLKAFRVQQYKSIRDTERVDINPDVTCLLGKNEVGKSSILQAIWKSSNVADARFDYLYDYPKGRYALDRHNDPLVTTLEFDLEAADFTHFIEHIGGRPPVNIEVDTTYGCNQTCRFELPPMAEVTPEQQLARNERVHEWIVSRLPAFVYFDDYARLETRIHLPSYLEASRQQSPDPVVRTQMALFEWTGLDPQELLELGRDRAQGEELEWVQRRKEVRSSLLEAASFALTEEWMKWWNQARQQLHITADGDDLVLKVSDVTNPYHISFHERSKGFQWFFSFYVTFLVGRLKSKTGVILLLDEPGLHLHVRAQQSLVEVFKQLSADNQIIYTSHSPFLIDTSDLNYVRIVYRDAEGFGQLAATTVSSATAPIGDMDTLMPLQTAVAHTLADTSFVGEHTLVVETIVDYWFVEGLRHALEQGDRRTLASSITTVFAGETANILGLASLFLRADSDDRRMVVLLSNERKNVIGARKLRPLLKQMAGALALMSDVDMLGKGYVGLYDLVERDELTAALERLNGPAERMPSENARRNYDFVRKVYAVNPWGKFTDAHWAKVVLKLVEGWHTGAHPATEGTLDNAETVMRALNKRFR